jgi:Phage integrase family
MTIPQPCPRQRKSLDAGVFQGEICSFRLHLAAEGKAAKTLRTYTDAVAWFAAHLIPPHLADQLGAGGRARCAEVAGPSAGPVQRRVCQQPVPGAAAVLQMARRGRADPRPDGPAARAEGDREAGAGVHQRRTIGPGENPPGPYLRPAPRRSSDRGAQGERDRAGELAGIRDDPHDASRSDLDLQQREITVRGKGGRPRIVRIGHEAARAVDRYLRIRSKHAQAWRPQLWLGMNNRGPMTANGIYQMIARRGRQCGVDAWPHRFRHHFSHTWLDRGGAEGDLMELNGWSSPQMLRRYGASARSARARRTYDRIMEHSP